MSAFDKDWADLDGWWEARAAVAARVNALPEQHRRHLRHVPVGAKVWDARGVFEVLAHGTHPTARSFAGYPEPTATLRHESGEVRTVLARDEAMPCVPNWGEAGALVWDGANWKLYRTLRPYDARTDRYGPPVADAFTGELGWPYPVESLQPWHGTADDFLRAFPGCRAAQDRGRG